MSACVHLLQLGHPGLPMGTLNSPEANHPSLTFPFPLNTCCSVSGGHQVNSPLSICHAALAGMSTCDQHLPERDVELTH